VAKGKEASMHSGAAVLQAPKAPHLAVAPGRAKTCALPACN
jgi:hypothetical protein